MEVITIGELGLLPEPEWLIKGVVAQQSTTMVYGEWGLGKSFMVLDMALTATTGEDWFGPGEVNRPLKSLYIIAEGAGWWARRIQAYADYRGKVNSENFRIIPHAVNLWHKPSPDYTDLVDLERAIADFRPDIVVIDTWVRCTSAFGMQEDSAGDTAKVMTELDRMRDKYNCSFVLVHHPTKSGGFRGSGNQGASLEIIVVLDRVGDGDSFAVSPEKGNHMEPWEPFSLGFEGVQTGQDARGEPITSAYLVDEGAYTKPKGGGGSNKRVKEQKDFWMAWHKGDHSGVAYSDIGLEYGVSSSTIGNWVKQYNEKNGGNKD